MEGLDVTGKCTTTADVKHEENESSKSTRSSITKRLRRRFSLQKSLAELRNPGLWNDAIVETVMCMYLNCSLIWAINSLKPDLYQVSITHIGIFVALVVVVLCEGFGPLCGASISPARSFAYCVAGGFTPARAALFTVAEFAGSAAGAMVAYWLTPVAARYYISAIVPGPGVTNWTATAVEAILTFNLMLVGLVVGDPRKPSLIGSVAVGFCVSANVMAAGTYTGGLQNPALALGPCLASGNFSRYWPYFVGPYIGASLASVFWMSINHIRYNYDHDYNQQVNKRHLESRDDDADGQHCCREIVPENMTVL